MLSKCSKISGESSVVRSTPFATEMRDIVGEAVNARRDRGMSEAVFQAARDLGISSRRTLAIMRGEVGRVWADELARAQQWHAQYCALQADRLAHDAMIYRARADALKDRLGC
jgi:hypothetical protein